MLKIDTKIAMLGLEKGGLWNRNLALVAPASLPEA